MGLDFVEYRLCNMYYTYYKYFSLKILNDLVASVQVGTSQQKEGLNNNIKLWYFIGHGIPPTFTMLQKYNIIWQWLRIALNNTNYKQTLLHKILYIF